VRLDHSAVAESGALRGPRGLPAVPEAVTLVEVAVLEIDALPLEHALPAGD
jgi:hypothetical protein